MQYLRNIIIALVILQGLISFAQSETSWIKKKDKTETVKKVEKEKTTSWIKKKEVKENKKKVKEKIKDSKSWITKKSKEKVKDIKEKLKKHKSFEKLPKGEFYFAGYIEPLENEDVKYVYGYVNSDKKSETFKVGNKSFYSRSDGVAYFEDESNRCEIDSFIGVLFGDIKGKVVLKCKNGLDITGDFKQIGMIGRGNGETSDGNFVKFKFFNTKIDAIAELENYRLDNEYEKRVVERQVPNKKKEKILLNPNGNYYALLIGNSKYTNGWSSLDSPVNDINSIKAVLNKKYDFKKILTVEVGTKKDIYAAFQKISELTTTNDYVLIYYSGHGQIKAEQAYWIPTDGSKNWGSGDWINISEIDIFLTEIKAHHLAVLVDSCFVGSKFKGMNIIDDIEFYDDDRAKYAKSLKSSLNLRSRSVLSSGTSGEVSDTVKGTGHSRFALSIINQLNVFHKKSYPLDLEQMAYLMKINYTKFQKPFMYHPDTWQHGGGNFIFIPKKNLK